MAYKMKGWSPFTKHDGTTSSTTHYADGSPKSKREVDFSKRHEDEKVKAGKNSDDENQNLQSHKDQWMHGQEMKRGKDGKMYTLEGHSWSTGDKKRLVKDPYNLIKGDYPTDDNEWYYTENKDGSLTLTGTKEYED